MPFLARAHILGSRVTHADSFAHAADPTPKITVGTQEVGLSIGYLLPHRLTQDHTTKQQGPAFMPYWMMTLRPYRRQLVSGSSFTRRRNGLYPISGANSHARRRLRPENQIHLRRT